MAGYVAVAGCTDGTGPTWLPQPRVKPEWVVGEAASALDTTSGLFRIALPIGLHVGRATSETFAVGAARLYGSEGPSGGAGAFFEAERGAAIDFAHAHPCFRATYSLSAYVDFPSEVPFAIRRSVGSAWAIPLCGADGSVHLSVGVPDNPTDVTVVDGELRIPQGGCAACFASAGVPVRFPWGLPLTPEAAVEVVFTSTGRRISNVPLAYGQRDEHGIGQLPLCASWRVEIDAPVVVRRDGTGELSQIAEFFVRRGPACFSDSLFLYAAAISQPATAWVTFLVNDSSNGATLDSAEVALAGPVRFDRVSVVK